MEKLFSKYFLLNISEGHNSDYQKNAVEKWIEKSKFAPIFYGDHTVSQILDASPNDEKFKTDEKSFVHEFSTDINDKILVSIGEKTIYIYKPAEKCREYKEEWGKEVNIGEKEQDTLYPKGFNVDILVKISLVEAPLVLATIKSNAWLGRGTFRNIKDDRPGSYFGNIKAIDWLISKEAKIKVSSFTEYLLCLSSLEFETLIAKFKEESGLFVPAYKGGFMKDFDLICKNYGLSQIEEKLQLKLHLYAKDYKAYLQRDSEIKFYCITCEDKIINMDNVFTAEKIQSELLNSPSTMKWLKQTLYWVEFSS